ncbi:Microfibrillar-associated protein 5 [Lemmus lemmus]
MSLQRLFYLLLLPGWETPKFHLNQFPLALFLVSKKDMPLNAVVFVKTAPSPPILSPFSQPLALYLYCLDLDFPNFLCVGQSAGMRNLLAQDCTLSIGQSNSAFIRSALPGLRRMYIINNEICSRLVCKEHEAMKDELCRQMAGLPPRRLRRSNYFRLPPCENMNLQSPSGL